MFRRYLPELKKRSHETQRPTSFSDLMEEFWKAPFDFTPFGSAEFPSVDLSEDDKEIVVKAEMPGLDPKDVDISINKGTLTLQGEKKFEDEEKKENYRRIERRYGSFYRSIPLPTEVDEDKVKAQYKKGILTITMPKSEEQKSKKIQIES